ncbi:MAG: hypothetical protein ACE5GD_04995 [Candidatus Geothermarchaeales archaeon]
MTGGKEIITAGIIVSIVFIIVGWVWFPVSVETLDEVAEHVGASEFSVWVPPLPEYEIPGFEGDVTMGIILSTAFTLLTLGVTLMVGKALEAKT